MNEYQSGDILKGLTKMAEESIKIRPSIKVLVSGLICQREENANEEDYAYKSHDESHLRIQRLQKHPEEISKSPKVDLVSIYISSNSLAKTESIM